MESMSNKIDFEKQYSKFHSNLDYKPISANARALYDELLVAACNVGRFDKLKLPNDILRSRIKNFSISSFQRARNELLNNNYIEYKKRNKSK